MKLYTDAFKKAILMPKLARFGEAADAVEHDRRRAVDIRDFVLKEKDSMFKAIAAGTLATVLFAGAALADGPAYTWTGYGVGSGKCPTYKMTIDITTAGNEVKGLFMQEGRTQRFFNVSMGADKKFKTKAIVGNNNTIDVVGSLQDNDPKIMLDGYCLFEGKLTKK